MKVESPKLPSELPKYDSPKIDSDKKLENAEVTGLDWATKEVKRLSFDTLSLINPDLTSAKLRSGGWADVRILGGTLAGANLTGSNLRRVEVTKARASGL